MVEKSRTPTVQIGHREKNGFHTKEVTRSYVVVLCEVGGSRVKAVRLDGQKSMDDARRTALMDNSGWKWKGTFPLTDRDFEEGIK